MTTTSTIAPAHAARRFLHSAAARPLRFAGTGVSAGVTQLLLLAFLTDHGWNALAANATAFILAAQVNFALSYGFTWRDRFGPAFMLGGAAGGLDRIETVINRAARCWLLFHCSIALIALVNMLVFVSARAFVPTLIASAAGIVVGALGNYFAGDRIVFRHSGTTGPFPDDRRQAA